MEFFIRQTPNTRGVLIVLHIKILAETVPLERYFSLKSLGSEVAAHGLKSTKLSLDFPLKYCASDVLLLRPIVPLHKQVGSTLSRGKDAKCRWQLLGLLKPA